MMPPSVRSIAKQQLCGLLLLLLSAAPIYVRGATETMQEAMHQLLVDSGGEDDGRVGASPRIVGGTPVESNQDFPSYGFTFGPILCGATLIHEDVVMTVGFHFRHNSCCSLRRAFPNDQTTQNGVPQ